MKSKLGPILRNIRLSKGIKQKDYADALGISQAQLGKIELGLHEPREAKVLNILKLLLPDIDLNKELINAEVLSVYKNG